MTNTGIVVIASILIGTGSLVGLSYVDATGQGVKLCEQVDDTNCLITFTWDPNETSDDPNEIIVINGVFLREGLVLDRTNDVSGNIDGMLVGQPKLEASKTVTNTVGSTEITTTIDSQSRAFNDLSGQIVIDGIVYDTHLKITGYDATQLTVQQISTGPSGTRDAIQEKLQIPLMVSMCDPENKCYEGFGTIRRETNTTVSPAGSVQFISDELEATVIGDDGLYELVLLRVQRTSNF